MQIRVLFFAVFRERIGKSETVVTLPAGSNVADLLAALSLEHGAIAELAGTFRIAVNESFAGTTTELVDGAEVALIPPVSGGNRRHIIITDQALSLQACIDAVAHAGAGGIATFTGNVRGKSKGKDIIRLEYEAYDAMALKQMIAIANAIESEIEGVKLAVEHRLGTLQIGEAAVVIAASAPHRKEAFAACEAMIDRLKESVPIWKKEFDRSGAVWVGMGP